MRSICQQLFGYVGGIGRRWTVVFGIATALLQLSCYSRFAFGGPLKGKHAKDVAGLLLKFIYLLGSLHILQSENGKEFDLSQVVEDFKTRQIHGRSYHPHSQGCVERFNRTLTEYFRRELYVACKGLALQN
jgi:transposase InsO family protein